MFAMRLDAPGAALVPTDLPDPVPGPGEVRLRVRACGVCRTDLHVVDGELPWPGRPVIPGHEVVGVIDALGAGVRGFAIGERVGVPWLGHTCGSCGPCLRAEENLCDAAKFTGYTRDGGYAELCVADAGYVFRLPDNIDDVHAAPLLCAGLIGFRAWRMATEERGGRAFAARRVGLYGFGGAAHLLAQLAVHEGKDVYAFTRPGDARGQAFARALGATWAGDSSFAPPVELDAAILFAPVGGLVTTALKAVRKGGRVICAGIHMSDVPSFPYRWLWGERSISSVANLTREDGIEWFERIAGMPLRIDAVPYALRDANAALADLRAGAFEGAAVLTVGR
jgi:propanol-preferring alcohol dehydrogenase